MREKRKRHGKTQSGRAGADRAAASKDELRLSPARRVSYIAILVALAMILSYVETLIPLNFGIPGIKLGLANLVILLGLFLLRPGDVLIISIARIFLVGFMFGNGASIIYSLAGGMLSFAVMLLMKKTKLFSMLGMSIAGGVAHNVGQIIAAALMVENIRMVYYLPVLIVSGVITGALIGILAGRILPLIQK